jgi:RES domain-containing protein
MRCWKICRRRYAAEAANGEGTRLYGGRWNSRGVHVVYASTSLALAAMETFVNLEPNFTPADLVSIEGNIPDTVGIGRLDLKTRPEDSSGVPVSNERRIFTPFRPRVGSRSRERCFAAAVRGDP